MKKERKIELENLSSQVLLQNDMYKLPVDLLQIAKNYGIKVFDVDFEQMGKKSISGAIRYIDGEFSILLNKTESENRKRFTLAHELGHYFLDNDALKSSLIHVDTLYRPASPQYSYVAKQENDSKDIELTNENEIDYFAGALLMNKMLVKKLVGLNTPINELADVFKVSVSAMTVRLDVLGLL